MINKTRLKSEKYKCTVCDEKFENLTTLQVHLYAEHNKDMKMDLLNKLSLKGDDNIEKAIKSKEDSFIDNEKGK